MTLPPSRTDAWGFHLLAISLGLLGVLGPTGEKAVAADCQVTSATTVTNGDAACVLDGDDSLEISNTGSIATTGVDAVLANGGNNTVRNSGSIDTVGDSAVGIAMYAGSGNNTVLGDGRINTQGDVSFGIYAEASTGGNDITAGDISTSGAFSHGIYAVGLAGQNNLTARSITTTGDYARGIYGGAEGGSSIHVDSLSTSGSNAHGIEINNTNGDNTIVAGSISTQGDSAFGIAMNSANGRAIISATDIVTTGSQGYGIWSFSAGSSVTVDRISTQSATGIYVYSSSGDNSVVAGEISTRGIGGEPIHLYTAFGNNTLTVRKVTTLGGSAYVTAQTGSGTNMMNIGDVSTYGVGSYGVHAISDNGSNIINTTGKILTYGEDAAGIWANSNSGANIVTNSGMIVTQQSQVIRFRESAENTLNLLAPSFIGGGFDFDGHIEHLNIETGSSHSVLWNFSDDPDAVPNVRGRVPYFYNKDREFAVMDPSGFAAMPNLLGDLADIAADAAESRNRTIQDGTPIWASLAGSQKDYDGNKGATLSQTIATSAAIVGVDIVQMQDSNFGVMAGFNNSNISIDAPYTYSYDNGAKGPFMGLYGKQTFERMLLSYSLSGGWLGHNDDRFVNDNLATINNRFLGRASAKSDYDSKWLSPSIRLSVPFAAPGGLTITPDIQMLYALQAVDDYTEQGSQADATVSDRVIQVSEIDAGVVASKSIGGILLSTRAGYTYRKSMGDDSATVSMIGETGDIPYFYNDTGAAYLGASVDAQLGQNAALRLRLDAMRGDGVEGASAAGSVIVKF